MKFLISQELRQGKYYVKVTLKEFTEDDQNRAKIFGMPKLTVRLSNGIDYPVAINELDHLPSYGFDLQKDADDYLKKLKANMSNLKNTWENLKDNWSKQELI